MTEHVCELTAIDTETWDTKIREEIVRCRDCKFCMSYWGADYCDFFSHVTNDPDGFCSWACRKEQQCGTVERR